MEYFATASLILGMVLIVSLVNKIDNSRENATQAVTNFILSMIEKYELHNRYEYAPMSMIKVDFKDRMDIRIRMLARWHIVANRVMMHLRNYHD